LQTLFLDMNPLSPSNGTNIAAKSYAPEPQKDGSQACTCGKEMFGCSIHPTTRDEWIASMRASLVKTLAGLGIKPGSETERAADFTEKCSELLTRFDPDTSSWKTSQQSLLTNGSEPFSETWPRAGMMRGGRVYRHLQPVPRTTVIDGGALRNVPTPTATLANHGGRITPSKARHGGTLIEHLSHLMWPTPTVNGNYNRKGASKTSGDGLATWAKMWQTPIANDAIARKKGNWNSRGEPKLSAEVLMWPTPQHRDYRMGDAPDSKRAIRKRKGSVTQSLVMERLEHPRGVRLPEELVRRGETGGQLNPDWTEWLMGFPIGHTALKPSATPKSRCKPRSRGNS
jgi:DNA (cytosine-5)-methyltransferase 1